VIQHAPAAAAHELLPSENNTASAPASDDAPITELAP
jgi:hypothetical protein